MQVTVESTGTLERRMRVELPAERIEKEVETRLKSVGRKAKIKGFRPGKIPAKVIRQHYGVQVRQEVLSELMQKSYSDAIAQENLNPVAGPKIEPELSKGGDGFAFVATFDVLPEVALKDLHKIEITRPEVEIGSADLDDMLMNLRKQKATWSAVERASANGDRVLVDFDGQLHGEAVEGGSGKEVPIILGGEQLETVPAGKRSCWSGDLFLTGFSTCSLASAVPAFGRIRPCSRLVTTSWMQPSRGPRSVAT